MGLVSSVTVAIAGILLAHAGAAQTSGTLSVLSYNIAGLPGTYALQLQRVQLTVYPFLLPEALSSSNPVNNTPIISPRVNQYDIVHVQEGRRNLASRHCMFQC